MINLVVLGGLSGCGKSTLIDLIRKQELMSLCSQIGITDIDSTLFCRMVDLEKENFRAWETIVVHYDIYTQMLYHNNFSLLKELIDSSESTKVLSLYAEPETLRERNAKKIRVHSNEQDPVTLRDGRFLQRQKEFYASDANVLFLYKIWFEFLLENSILDSYYLDSPFGKNTSAQTINKTLLEQLILKHVVR